MPATAFIASSAAAASSTTRAAARSSSQPSSALSLFKRWMWSAVFFYRPIFPFFPPEISLLSLGADKNIYRPKISALSASRAGCPNGALAGPKAPPSPKNPPKP
ncbi:hypothetical protein PVAP13_4NG133838 [Panicum virgatum]|uniref:Uncharacterized protein n=1 Tax=Panicum virgatum TaxID=38727 RepID=A0A8T0SZM2_PANVG|nr:hypothetical protein PVAP13_4NG133838 [Panicum virgatum]